MKPVFMFAVLLVLLVVGVRPSHAECATGGTYILNFDGAPATIDTFAASDAASPDGSVKKTDLRRCLPVIGQVMQPKRRIQIDLGSGRTPWLSRTGITVGGAVKCRVESGESSTGAGRASNPGCEK